MTYPVITCFLADVHDNATPSAPDIGHSYAVAGAVHPPGAHSVQRSLYVLASCEPAGAAAAGHRLLLLPQLTGVVSLH